MFDRFPEKLRSRKLWLTFATFLSAVLAEIFGVSVDPEVLFGVAAAVGSYNIGQGLVDKASAQATNQLREYANYLQEQLAALAAENVDLASRIQPEDYIHPAVFEEDDFDA